MDEIKPIMLLIISGLALRYSLIFAGQAWAKSYSQTITFMILHIITYVITKTIAGNIALSLGMIGALSIVRFRHPVKSALELVIYFDLITIGIATSVRTKWAVQLIICSLIIIVLTKFLQSVFKKFNKNFYSLSFNEGNINNVLEIVSKKKLDLIEKNDNLINYFVDTDTGEYSYKLTFSDKKSLEQTRDLLDTEKNITKINVTIN